ncbi:MAG: ribosome small subunit-dependent GTPase A [Calditrichota bacterium]
MFELSDLGFSSFFENQVTDSSFDYTRLARISAEHRSEYEILTPKGTDKAYLSGNWLKERDGEALPKVGDWVVLDTSNQILLIERILTRKTTLARGAAGKETTSQVLATNVDLVFIVAGLDWALNPHRIERYLSLVWSSGATPIVVLNKSDLAEDALVIKSEAEEHCPGVSVILASSHTVEGLGEIRAQLCKGITAVFIGPSGVGKSTLINTLIGERRMDTNAVRTGDLKGRHTTVHRQLIVLPDGGLVIDTPGLRELQLTESDGIAAVFPEIEALADQCRFRDCTHQSEPGCAVIQAVEQGSIRRERYEHYLKLQHDAQSFDLRHNEHLRRQSERVWGKLSREGNMIRRLKGDR